MMSVSKANNLVVAAVGRIDPVDQIRCYQVCEQSALPSE